MKIPRRLVRGGVVREVASDANVAEVAAANEVGASVPNTAGGVTAYTAGRGAPRDEQALMCLSNK